MKKRKRATPSRGCPFPFYSYYYMSSAFSAIPGFSVLYEHHVCLPLFLRECFLYQPRAEHVCMVGVQPEGNGDDDFKRVNIRVQPVFKPHVAAHLVVVQHVRLADGSDGGVHSRDAVWNSPAISVAVIHISLPVTLTVLSSMMMVPRVMASLFLDGAT